MAEETWIRWTTTSKQVLPRWLFPQLQCETHPLYLHLFADTRPKGYGAAASLSSGKQSSTATNAMTMTMTNWEKQPSIHILINVSRLITLSCLLVYEDKEFFSVQRRQDAQHNYIQNFQGLIYTAEIANLQSKSPSHLTWWNSSREDLQSSTHRAGKISLLAYTQTSLHSSLQNPTECNFYLVLMWKWLHHTKHSG